MAQSTHSDPNLIRSLKYTAIVTGLMAMFNAVFMQWLLVVFFAIIAIGTGVVAWKKTKDEQHGVPGAQDAGTHE